MDKLFGFKIEEILTCLLLVVVGYAISKMFRSCTNIVDGFVSGDAYNGTNFDYGSGSYICEIIDQKYKGKSDDKIKKCECLDAGCYFAKNDNQPSKCFFDARVKKYKTYEEYYNHYLNNDYKSPDLGLCSEKY